MRVLFVNTPGYIGGAEISLLSLIGGLERKRFDPMFVTETDGPLLRRVGELGIEGSALPFAWFSRRRPWTYAASILRLAHLVRSRDVDLIHTNCDHSLRYVQIASRLTGVPYVSHVRDFVRTWFEPNNLSALKAAARVICNSSATRQRCLDAGLSPDSLAMIANPIDVQAFQNVPPAQSQAIRDELGLTSEATLIGIIGQVQPLKGHAEFLSAALRLAERVPSAHFLIVGAPPPGADGQAFYDEQLERIAASAYSQRIHLMGFRENVAPILSALDILAVPSWTESFGRTAVEGQAAGCAVVATNAGGLAEIVADDQNGLVIEPRDPEQLEHALFKLATRPELRSRLAVNGRKSAARYNVESHVQAVEALYERVARHRVRRRVLGYAT